MSGLKRKGRILLAENDDDHILLTTLAFERAGVEVDLDVVRDGAECLDFLRRRGAYAQARRPDLLLLDMHMPRLGGAEVMQQIAADPALRGLPVVALTTSGAPSEVAQMYGLRVSSFISKPVDFESFKRCVAVLAAYWFELVILPEDPQD